MFRGTASRVLVVGSLGSLAMLLATYPPAVFGERDSGEKVSPPVQSAVNTDDNATRATDKATETTDDAASRAARGKALERRAGEKVDNRPRGQALVLGMSLQEAAKGRAKVVAVGPGTPAFLAGVREGDEIVSYQGFSTDSYRKWIDGIHRLTTDAPAESSIPIVVSRAGTPMALQIQVPTKPVRLPKSPPPKKQQGQQGQEAAGGAPATPDPYGQPPNVPPGVGGGLVGTGAGGDSFGDQQPSSPHGQAAAELIRLNVPPPAPGGIQGSSAAGGAPGAINDAQRAKQLPTPLGGGGTRIGMASFHDDPQGMVVMVDVGALAPGNYSVAITDASAVGGLSGGTGVVPPGENNVVPPGANNAVPRGANNVGPGPGVPVQSPINNENRGRLPQNQPVATPAAPANGGQVPAANGGPQSSWRPDSNELVPRTVLAQVVESGAGNGPAGASGATPAGTSASPAVPSNGQTRASGGQLRGGANPAQPPNGRVNAGQRPDGQPIVGDAQRDSAIQPGTEVGQNDTDSNGGIGAGGLQNELGTLTVDQSGTGRMQKTVPGMQVQNVVGQAVAIYSQGTQQTALPPNLNAGAGAATRQGVLDSTSAQGSQGTGNENRGVVRNGGMPVAAGVIRLISDRRPPATGADATSVTPGTNSGIEQPASATPTTGPGITR